MSGFEDEIRGVSFVDGMALGFGDKNRSVIWEVGKLSSYSIEIIQPRELTFLFKNQKPRLLEVSSDPSPSGRFTLAYSEAKVVVSTLDKGVFEIEVLLQL